MWQELFRIPLPFGFPALTIHGFGLMLVIGFLIAMEVSRRLARRSGIDPELFANAAIIALITGILGARLSHVLENLDEYTRSDRSFGQNFADAINITSGGLTYYGGFLLAFASLVGYALWKKIPLRVGMDIVAPCLMIGLGFGRVGCFLNGCCFGAACELPWAVTFPYGSPPHVEHVRQGKIEVPQDLLVPDSRGEDRLVSPAELRAGATEQPNPLDPRRNLKVPLPRNAREVAASLRSVPVHPTQLYSAITALGLAVVLLAHFNTSRAPGQTFALMMMLEGAARFTLELLRVEPTVMGRMSFSMVIAPLLVVGGALLWFAFSRPKPSAATVPATA